MTTVSIGDCIKDTGYLAEYTNVDFLPLPKNNGPENEQKKPEKSKSESEEENENLKSQIDDLTKELNEMKSFMSQKLKQQVNIIKSSLLSLWACHMPQSV